MSANEVHAGYLDVKVSAKARRGFTPWKAWRKQWCVIKRLDNINNGVELTLKTCAEGATINQVVLPRSATVCRIESRSKSYAFGVFTLGRSQKPLLFLSGDSESKTQRWMELIRKSLCIASYIPVGSLNFHISFVDNSHSRAARLLGLFGILSANSQEITINEPTTGENIIRWKWHQFHQFHLQAVSHPEDENTICVLHTSRDFMAGAGHLYLYCKEAPRLLDLLVSRGKTCLGLAASNRLSHSESDLSKLIDGTPVNDLRNLSDSEDSGVRSSLSSNDSNSHMKTTISPSLTGLLSKTPGGSEADDDDVDSVGLQQLKRRLRIPRGESGVSLASGVYEEISETLPAGKDCSDVDLVDGADVYTNGHMVHLYEDLEELFTSISFTCAPPPLPPRVFSSLGKNCDNPKNESKATPNSASKVTTFIRNSHKYRSNTLPAKDLKRLSQTFTATHVDPEYMVMRMPKNKKEKNKMSVVTEGLYMPMSPIISLKAKLENCYMAMSGKKC